MTKEEAAALGYKVIEASPFEVGLVKNGKGIRTWFTCQSFEGILPELDHPFILKEIEIEENHVRNSSHVSAMHKDLEELLKLFQYGADDADWKPGETLAQSIKNIKTERDRIRSIASHLSDKWIREESQYRKQVHEAMEKGTPFTGMAAMADGIKQCRVELQQAFGLVGKKDEVKS